jgi:hypothetical protein
MKRENGMREMGEREDLRREKTEGMEGRGREK